MSTEAAGAGVDLEERYGPDAPAWNSANEYAFLQDEVDRLRTELDALQHERSQLREQLAEWESVNVAQVELRGLVESHMDTARGEWECVAEVEQLRAAVTSVVADKMNQGLEIERLQHEHRAALDALAQEKYNVEQATQHLGDYAREIEPMREVVEAARVVIADPLLEDASLSWRTLNAALARLDHARG